MIFNFKLVNIDFISSLDNNFYFMELNFPFKNFIENQKAKKEQ
jgi:hypothetical protein